MYQYDDPAVLFAKFMDRHHVTPIRKKEPVRSIRFLLKNAVSRADAAHFPALFLLFFGPAAKMHGILLRLDQTNHCNYNSLFMIFQHLSAFSKTAVIVKIRFCRGSPEPPDVRCNKTAALRKLRKTAVHGIFLK